MSRELFATELADLVNRHGIVCNTCVQLINYDQIMRRDFAENLVSIPIEFKDTLRRMAAHYLEYESLSEDERKYLELIEGGELPAPLKYQEIALALVKNDTEGSGDSEEEV